MTVKKLHSYQNNLFQGKARIDKKKSGTMDVFLLYITLQFCMPVGDKGGQSDLANVPEEVCKLTWS